MRAWDATATARTDGLPNYCQAHLVVVDVEGRGNGAVSGAERRSPAFCLAGPPPIGAVRVRGWVGEFGSERDEGGAGRPGLTLASSAAVWPAAVRPVQVPGEVSYGTSRTFVLLAHGSCTL